jgi:hypothetical protein
VDTTIGKAPRGTGKGVFPRVAVTLLVVATLGPLAVQNAVAALGDPATGQEGGFRAGTVYITSDGGGQATLSMPDGAPGQVATSYTTIRYEGSLPAGVRLYASTSGTGLARFLRLTITRGKGAGKSFIPDSIDYAGAGPGVLYRGTLAAFPSDWANGVVDPQSWMQGASHTYRFVAKLANDPAAEGLTAEASFSWEARSA